MSGLDGAILWGLAAAVGWGGGDFCGGLAARRASLFGVGLGVQLVSLVLSLLLVALNGPGPISTSDVVWSVVTGLVGAAALTSLYRGLATGRMGVVAPVSGVLAAGIPVVVGGLLEGFPGATRAAGLALGIVAVLVVSRTAGGGGRAGLGLGVAAGLGFGFYAVAIGQLETSTVWLPLAIARSVGVALVLLVVVAGRQPVRVPAAAAPLIVITGLADVAGNLAFFLATQAGRLDVAGVLSALYPVTTVILATLVLRERVDRAHLLGIALALGAIALIAGG